VRRRDLGLLGLGIVAVSFSSILVRAAGNDDAPAFAIAFYRCAFAAAILVPLAWARHRDEVVALTRRQWGLALLSGLVLSGHFATWIPSISLTTVAASAVLVQTQPVWVALFGRFVGERTSRLGIVGIGVAIAGTLVISGGGFEAGSRAAAGDLLAIAGALFGAVYVLLGRNLRPSISLVTYTGIVYTTSAVALAGVMVVTSTPFTGFSPKVWGLFLLITLGPQFGGHTVFNYLLGHLRASVVSVALLAEPVGAAILALLLLDEVPPVSTVVGGAIVLVGVFIAIRAEASRRPEVLVQPVD
jgi:drug/metabolite transporter (DMT)-like permease